MVWKTSLIMGKQIYASEKLKNIKSDIKINEEIPHLNKCNPFTHIHDKLSLPVPVKPDPELPIKKNNEDITLAFISLRKVHTRVKKRNKKQYKDIYRTIKYNAIEDRALIKSDNIDDSIVRNQVYYSENLSKKIFESFKKSIEQAIYEYKADILCINELGFPSQKSCNYYRARIDAIGFARSMAQEHKCLILAGSVHDHVTHYNTAYIFYPGCNNFGAFYHKQISAHRVTELISIPPERKTFFTKAFGLRIGFLTCIDVSDFSSVLPLIKLDEKIDLLLVPSYTKDHEILDKAANGICKAIIGYVGFSNYNRGGSDPSGRFFKFDSEEPLEAVEEKIKNRDLEYEINIHKINLNTLKEEKAEYSGNIDKNIRWLFGIKEGPS